MVGDKKAKRRVPVLDPATTKVENLGIGFDRDANVTNGFYDKGAALRTEFKLFVEPK